MKKLFVEYNDNSKITYTLKNNVDHMKYVYKHIMDKGIKSITLQEYPKKDNEPITYTGGMLK